MLFVKSCVSFCKFNLLSMFLPLFNTCFFVEKGFKVDKKQKVVLLKGFYGLVSGVYKAFYNE